MIDDFTRKANLNLFLAGLRLLRFKRHVGAVGSMPPLFDGEKALCEMWVGRRTLFVLVKQTGPVSSFAIPDRSGVLIRKVMPLSRMLSRIAGFPAFSFRWVRARLNRKRYGHILVLGYNCELAYRFITVYGGMDASLFAWGYSPSIDVTLQTLAHLDRLFAGTALRPTNETCMHGCGETGYWLHGKATMRELLDDASGEVCYQKDIADLRSRVMHLRKKFIDQLTDAESTLAVYKMRPCECEMGDVLAHRLLDALARLGARNCRLLIVCERKAYESNRGDGMGFPMHSDDYLVRTVETFNPIGAVATQKIGDGYGWRILWVEFAPGRIVKKEKTYKFQKTGHA